jgi:hypothetical protein
VHWVHREHARQSKHVHTIQIWVQFSRHILAWILRHAIINCRNSGMKTEAGMSFGPKSVKLRSRRRDSDF